LKNGVRSLQPFTPKGLSVLERESFTGTLSKLMNVDTGKPKCFIAGLKSRADVLDALKASIQQAGFELLTKVTGLVERLLPI
jgi:hypothetical protein